MSVGFIGLGNIGKPMAMHWARGEEPLMVFDVVAQATVDLVAAGATAAPSVAELARQSRIIGICVRDDKEVEQLLSGTGGILENARPNSVILIHSTVKQESILEWHERGKSRSVHIIDASVTRATEPNKFCYMLGGDAAVVDRCRTLLSTGGNAVVHAGPVGSAIALKLCNNMMTYASFIAIHEAYKLAQAFGIDPELLHQVSNTNGVITPSMAGFIRARGQIAKQVHAVLKSAYGPHGALGKKDMAAALLCAFNFNLSLPGSTEDRRADCRCVRERLLGQAATWSSQPQDHSQRRDCGFAVSPWVIFRLARGRGDQRQLPQAGAADQGARRIWSKRRVLLAPSRMPTKCRSG